MPEYALLSEVYPTDLKSKPKRRKKKKVTFQDEGPNGPIVPMSPQEMDTELLDDEPVIDGSRTLRNMKTSPYSPDGPEYQHLSQESYQMSNEHLLPYSKPMRRLGYPMTKMSHQDEDPEYLEFLEFKKSKQTKQSDDLVPSLSSLTGQGEQFNELLLYMFTGFFLLMLYDNVYKLGRDAY
jgi:hypothetical protein